MTDQVAWTTRQLRGKKKASEHLISTRSGHFFFGERFLVGCWLFHDLICVTDCKITRDCMDPLSMGPLQFCSLCYSIFQCRYEQVGISNLTIRDWCAVLSTSSFNGSFSAQCSIAGQSQKFSWGLVIKMYLDSTECFSWLAFFGIMANQPSR